MIIENAMELIGSTPIVKYKDIFVKLEKCNPCGSIKDRAALWMVEKAEEAGLINKGTTIIEPTSGNTGISLAMIGKQKGYKVIIIMPESMSMERRTLIEAYGGELILTDKNLGMEGAIKKAIEIKDDYSNYYIPNQFSNVFNMLSHYEGTSEEIIKELNTVDIFVAGVGTGGSIVGIGKRLKEINNDVKIFAVEPESSKVLSGEQKGSHNIQGIGAGFIPKLYDYKLIEDVIGIKDEEAFRESRNFTDKTGFLVGISTGANLKAALMLKEKYKDKIIVTLAPDGGEKYISMGLYNNV